MLVVWLVGGLVGLIHGSNFRFSSLFFSGAALVAAVYQLIQLEDRFLIKFNWTNEFSVGLLYEKQSAILLVLVTFISFLIHLFSHEYMKNENTVQTYDV